MSARKRDRDGVVIKIAGRIYFLWHLTRWTSGLFSPGLPPRLLHCCPLCCSFTQHACMQAWTVKPSQTVPSFFFFLLVLQLRSGRSHFNFHFELCFNFRAIFLLLLLLQLLLLLAEQDCYFYTTSIASNTILLLVPWYNFFSSSPFFSLSLSLFLARNIRSFVHMPF